MAVDPESQLITAVAVLPGNAPDNKQSLEFADAGPSRGRMVAKVQDRPNSAQIPKEDFHIDTENKTCTCPAGQECRTPESLGRRKDRNGKSQEWLGFKCDPVVCGVCLLRPKCVAAGPGKGRTAPSVGGPQGGLSLHPQETLLQEVRGFERSYPWPCRAATNDENPFPEQVGAG